MYNLISQLIIYKNSEKNRILYELSDILRKYDNNEYDIDETKFRINTQINNLLQLATNYGLTRIYGIIT